MEFKGQVGTPQTAMPQSVIEALESGLTAITSNQRAARTLRLAFDRHNRSKGLESWQPAAVLAWDAWTAEMWQRLVLEGHATRMLLNRTQEHVVWCNIIAKDTAALKTIRSTDSLAELAADAWRILNQNNATDRLQGEDSRIFRRWITTFEHQCRDHDWLPAASLEIALQPHAVSGHLRIGTGITLLGFDEITPARNSLLKAVQASGAEVRELELSISAEVRRLVRSAGIDEELTAAACWAREHLRRNPQARIAIIEPALESRRSVIQRRLREVLAPELEEITASNDAAPYEFSIGSRLDETPLVRVAFDLLHWVIGPLPIDRVSPLLVSPLFAMAGDESDARAAFDAYELRKQYLLRPEISLERLEQMLWRSERRSQLEDLRKALTSLRYAADKHKTATATRTYSEWSGVIRDLLEAARWGRSDEEDFIEFQTLKRWENALDELATLDFDGSRVSFGQALTTIERVARLTMFAPESRDAPVQVLGPLEAAGSTFDALWFLGAGDLTWPEPSTLNPLLPRPLARGLGLPGASLASDNERAKGVAARIAGSAREIVLSYPALLDSGRQRPAALLEALHLKSVEAAEVAPIDTVAEPVTLEEFSDSPLPPLPDAVFHGGAGILQSQAACPFRAFAEHRLRSKELESVELGMDDRERGSVLHKVLESFWNEVRTKDALKALTETERKETLARAIEHGLRKAADSSTAEWDTAYIQVQRERLHRLLLPWLEIELARSEFTVSQAEKKLHDVHIGPLRLDVRIDRVDIGANGRTIIDYKTGTAKPARWKDDRPDEPQLPLYAVVASDTDRETPVAEIAFGRIRPGETALDGFNQRVTAARTIGKLRPPMNEQIGEWRSILERLAAGFYHGDANVDPKDYPHTCRHCAQRTLCRLDPAAFEEDLDDEAANDTGNG